MRRSRVSKLDTSCSGHQVANSVDSSRSRAIHELDHRRVVTHRRCRGRNSAKAWRAWMSQSTISSRVEDRRTAPRADSAAAVRTPRCAGTAGPARCSRRRTPTAVRGRRPGSASTSRSSGPARVGGSVGASALGVPGSLSASRWLIPASSRSRARPMASSTSDEALIRRPCSSHVYQVTDTPARSATSSRRRPGVRRFLPAGNPTWRGCAVAPSTQERGQLWRWVGSEHRSSSPVKLGARERRRRNLRASSLPVHERPTPRAVTGTARASLRAMGSGRDPWVGRP